jgi:hypothetical protein
MDFFDFLISNHVFTGGAHKFLGHLDVLAFLDTFTEESGATTRIKLCFERCLIMCYLELLLDQLLIEKPKQNQFK